MLRTVVAVVRAGGFGIALALIACGDDAAEPDLLDASAPSCAPGADGLLPLGCSMEPSAIPSLDSGGIVGAAEGGLVPPGNNLIDAGAMGQQSALLDGGAVTTDASAAPPPPRPVLGQVGPCVRSDTVSRVYNLCVWTSPQDLSRIHSLPEARFEVAAAVSLNGELHQGAELEIHGGSGRLWPKKSYRVRFREKPRPSYDYFGTGEDKVERLVLQAAWIDPTFVRNKIIFDTLTELGALAPRLGYARVYLNGQLNGLYQIIERIDEHYLERQSFSRMGNLYKAESAGADFRVHDNPLLGFSENTNEDGAADDLADLFRTLFQTPETYAAYQREIATRIDLNDFDLWNIVMSHALNLDTFIKNYYLYHDPSATDPKLGSIFRIIHWDADASFGIGWNTPRAPNPERAALWSQVDGELQDNDLARRMYAIPEYRAAYLARFDQLLRGPLSAAALWAKAEPLMTALEPDIRADATLWSRNRPLDEERAFLKQMVELRARVMTSAVAQARAQP
jgi:hypothetical protein